DETAEKAKRYEIRKRFWESLRNRPRIKATDMRTFRPANTAGLEPAPAYEGCRSATLLAKRVESSYGSVVARISTKRTSEFSTNYTVKAGTSRKTSAVSSPGSGLTIGGGVGWPAP